MHDADREGAVRRGHGVDGEDLARHLANGGAAGGECGAGMARLADRLEVKARDRVTPGDDAIVRPARLRHQHVFVARGFRLDDVAGRGRADFLVGREQHGDRQRRRERGPRQLPDRFQRQVIAALHVEDSGPEALVAVAPPLQFFQGTDRMHGIEMSCDQDAGLARFGMRKARADAAGKTLPAGDALDGRTHDRHVAGGDVEHALHGGRIPGRAFAFHPAAQSLQHGLGIKGKIGWVHLDSLFYWFAADVLRPAAPAGAYENDRR